MDILLLLPYFYSRHGATFSSVVHHDAYVMLAAYTFLLTYFAGFQCTPQVSIASDANEPVTVASGIVNPGERRSSSFDISPSAAARSGRAL